MDAKEAALATRRTPEEYDQMLAKSAREGAQDGGSTKVQFLEQMLNQEKRAKREAVAARGVFSLMRLSGHAPGRDTSWGPRTARHANQTL